SGPRWRSSHAGYAVRATTAAAAEGEEELSEHPVATVSDDAEYAYLWGRRAQLLHRVRLSALYHRDRERTYDRLDRGSKLLALASSSAALAGLIGDQFLGWLLAAVALSSAASLTFSFSERAREHADFAARW